MSSDLVNDVVYAVVNESSDSFFGITQLGLRNNNQKVMPSMNGMINIINIVLIGETPMEISAAYEKLPKIPAPPVPLDQVLITFLQGISMCKMVQFLFFHQNCMKEE